MTLMLHNRTQLWTNIESCLDVIHTRICRMIQLQKVLCKKKDPSGLAFSDWLLAAAKDDGDSRGSSSIVDHVWGQVAKAVKAAFKTGAADSPVTKQAMEAEYPKLVRLFNDLWARYSDALKNIYRRFFEHLLMQGFLSAFFGQQK